MLSIFYESKVLFPEKCKSSIYVQGYRGSIQKQEYMHSGTPSQVKIKATIQAEKGNFTYKFVKSRSACPPSTLNFHINVYVDAIYILHSSECKESIHTLQAHIFYDIELLLGIQLIMVGQGCVENFLLGAFYKTVTN